MSTIAINNLFILLSVVIVIIGLIGGTYTKKNYESKYYEIFKALNYIGAIAFIIFITIRGGIFLAMGGIR